MNTKKVLLAFAAGLAIQGGAYVYMDTVLFAPASDFEIAGTSEQEALGFDVAPNGRSHLSFDKRFMAVTGDDQVAIYEAGKKGAPQHINLHGKRLSFFEWLPDRNLAIFATYGYDNDGDYHVDIGQYDPVYPERELDTPIEDVPEDSKIVDAAYSTATNVVYMKVELEPQRYRIYRTDANYDTRRIHVQAEDIGRIAVFYDEDIFFYDNLRTGVVYMFEGATSSWRDISPAGTYRLVGVDGQDIYIAELDRDDKVIALYEGRLRQGFVKIASYKTPEDFSAVTVAAAREAAEAMGTEKE